MSFVWFQRNQGAQKPRCLLTVFWNFNTSVFIFIPGTSSQDFEIYHKYITLQFLNHHPLKHTSLKCVNWCSDYLILSAIWTSLFTKWKQCSDNHHIDLFGCKKYNNLTCFVNWAFWDFAAFSILFLTHFKRLSSFVGEKNQSHNRNKMLICC